MNNFNKNYINVPINIKYISDWFDIKNYINFSGHIILNKIVTGCGFTEYFLRNNDPIILCSPRKVLLENKYEQHLSDVYLVKNELERWAFVDEDISNMSKYPHKATSDQKKENTNYLCNMKEDIKKYIQLCLINQVAPKILVTYDSLKHVLEAVYEIGSGNFLNQFQVVVDEFQSIFTDASFKASTELNFVGYLQSVPNVCYLSATPLLDNYLSLLDEFKNLPYYELVWDSSKIICPKIDRKKVRSLLTACCDIINDYLSGKFKTKFINGYLQESREVVFFINSVADIKNIINKINKTGVKLTPDNVNIICSDTKKNRKSLQQINFTIGSVPLENQPHKMFTFCTRTVYLGADFYSTCARTVICSDSNVDCLALDISLDLPQIIGRQRLESNVFRYDINFFYKTTEKFVTKEEFQKIVEEKCNKTKNLISAFETAADDSVRENLLNIYREHALVKKYSEDFLGVSEYEKIPKFNSIVMVSNIRAWEIQQLNYKDEVAVYNTLYNEGLIFDSPQNIEAVLEDFKNNFFQDNNFVRRMKLYCEFSEKFGNSELKNPALKIPDDFHLYYDFIGSEKIRSCGYMENRLSDIIDDAKKNDPLLISIYNNFFEGDKYYGSIVKEKLQEIYLNLGLKKAPKAIDIIEYFEVKDIMFRDKATGKRIKGYELIKRLK